MGVAGPGGRPADQARRRAREGEHPALRRAVPGDAAHHALRSGRTADRPRSRDPGLARPPGTRGASRRMQPRVAASGAACLLGGPTVVAFFSGGYYTEPRVIAAIVAWGLVLALALTGPAPLPRSRAGILAVAGLALLAAWSALSITWAPLAGPAVEDVQRL